MAPCLASADERNRVHVKIEKECHFDFPLFLVRNFPYFFVDFFSAKLRYSVKKGCHIERGVLYTEEGSIYEGGIIYSEGCYIKYR